MLVYMLDAVSNQMPEYRMYWHLQITDRFIYYDSRALSQQNHTLPFQTDDRRRIKDSRLWEHQQLSSVYQMGQQGRGTHFKKLK